MDSSFSEEEGMNLQGLDSSFSEEEEMIPPSLKKNKKMVCKMNNQFL